jgi:hypothetical protein
MKRRTWMLTLVVALLAAAGVATGAGGGSSAAAPARLMLVQANRPAESGDGPTERDARGLQKTIAGLRRLSVVGSTQFIVDQAGHTASVDANPYGVAVVSAAAGRTHGLKAGDILVTNIGAEDKGTTLVRFPAGEGPGHLFNAAANAGTVGPANIAVDARNGTVWISNASGNNLQVLNGDGSVRTTITDPLLNHPWGLATNQGDPGEAAGAAPAFFTSNVADATIDRVVAQQGRAGTTFKVAPVGRLPKTGDKTKIGLAWVPRATIKGQALSDVLLAVDPADNSLVAFPNASEGPVRQGITVFQGKPVNLPNDLTINPLNGDAILTNLNDNNLVEIDLVAGKAVATRTVDNVPVDGQTGNGSALIGLDAISDVHGNLVVYFVDDNMNTLNVLSS